MKSEFKDRLAAACSKSPDVPYENFGRQKVIADILGVSKEASRKYFKGEAVPRKAKMEKLASFLGVDVMWLMMGLSSGEKVRGPDQPAPSKPLHGYTYVAYGLMLEAGYACAFGGADDFADFYAIRDGHQQAIRIFVGEPIEQPGGKVIDLRFKLEAKPLTTEFWGAIKHDDGTVSFVQLDADGVNKNATPKRDGSLVFTASWRGKSLVTAGHTWKPVKIT